MNQYTKSLSSLNFVYPIFDLFLQFCFIIQMIKMKYPKSTDTKGTLLNELIPCTLNWRTEENTIIERQFTKRFSNNCLRTKFETFNNLDDFSSFSKWIFLSHYNSLCDYLNLFDNLIIFWELSEDGEGVYLSSFCSPFSLTLLSKSFKWYLFLWIYFRIKLFTILRVYPIPKMNRITKIITLKCWIT